MRTDPEPDDVSAVELSESPVSDSDSGSVNAAPLVHFLKLSPEWAGLSGNSLYARLARS